MNVINIVGLGPGDISLISHGALEMLKSNLKKYFRTEEHPIVNRIKEQVEYTSLDYFYEDVEDFDNVYNNISEFIVDEAKKHDLVYAVPGHPMVAEKTVGIIKKLASEHNIKVNIIASMSFVDAIFNYLSVDPSAGFQLLDALDMKNSYIDTHKNVIITQVYDRFIASDVKLILSENYGYDREVIIVKAAGVNNMQTKKSVNLFELDRKDNVYDHLTSLYIPQSPVRLYNNINDLEYIVETLRGPEGCEWDKRQTHDSLKKYLIEESYELLDAINNFDYDNMIEELGDVLLQVMLHCQLGKEEGYFDLSDVISILCKKLIFRHPHVFKNGEDVYFENAWDKLKMEEKGEKTITEGLYRIPTSLPSLLKASKVQKKVAKVGFDWKCLDDILKKVEEEYRELLDECVSGNIKYIEEELGDLLFSIVNIARFLELDAEEVLNDATNKFIDRFNYIETKSIELHKDLKKMSIDEMKIYWNQTKNKNK